MCISVPINYLEVRVNRKPGDQGTLGCYSRPMKLEGIDTSITLLFSTGFPLKRPEKGAILIYGVRLPTMQ